MTDEAVLRAFAKAIYLKHRADSRPVFSMVIEDPELGHYGVSSRTFVDADRAGFSDYVTEGVVGGLSQVEAARAIALLDAVGKGLERAARPQ